MKKIGSLRKKDFNNWRYIGLIRKTIGYKEYIDKEDWFDIEYSIRLLVEYLKDRISEFSPAKEKQRTLSLAVKITAFNVEKAKREDLLEIFDWITDDLHHGTFLSRIYCETTKQRLIMLQYLTAFEISQSERNLNNWIEFLDILEISDIEKEEDKLMQLMRKLRIDKTDEDRKDTLEYFKKDQNVIIS